MPSAKPLILNVDDSEAALYAKSRILCQAGYDVVEASTGSETLELVRARRPNLVLLDLKLPDMSGYEVCGRIKGSPETAAVLVLQISATYAGGSDRVRGLDSGADGYLAEPVEPQELLATIRAFLRLQRAEEALRESEAKYRTLMESLADGVFVAQNGRFVFANDELTAMLGYSLQELIGLPFAAVIAPEFLPIWNERLAERVAGTAARVRYEVQMLRKGGAESLWVEVRASRVMFGGELAVLGVLRDVTARNRMERVLRERTDALLAQDRYKDEFLAMLSHELRNPLAPLSNALTLLRSGRSDTQQTAQLVAMMGRQLEHLLRLVNDLLDASRVTRGMINIEAVPVDLKKAIAHGVEGAHALIAARQHRYEQSLPEEPLIVNGDMTRLGQVFVNLLNNAAKYTAPGGTINVTATREAEHAVVRVRDTGQGIPAELLPKIFDLFMQADRAFDRSHGGLGIGLTLAQRLVRAHGGVIEAASAGPGKGSEFTVRLPLSREAAVPPVTPSRPAAAVRRRILVADDNPDVATSTAELLSALGHEVRAVSDSSRVLQSVADFGPDVVLMDIGMPGLDGLELARCLRRDFPSERLRIVAITGYGDQRTRELTNAAGFDEHLVKPVDLAAVERLLASLPLPQPAAS